MTCLSWDTLRGWSTFPCVLLFTVFYMDVVPYAVILCTNLLAARHAPYLPTHAERAMHVYYRQLAPARYLSTATEAEAYLTCTAFQHAPTPTSLTLLVVILPLPTCFTPNFSRYSCYLSTKNNSANCPPAIGLRGNTS